jgi:sugar phosphate isomerase/epimerase
MNRRDVLLSIGGGISASLLGTPRRLLGSSFSDKTGLGVCIYCLGIRSRAERQRGGRADFSDPLTFLEYCHRLGAGGIQLPLNTKDEAYCAKLGGEAEKHGMFVEGILGLPNDRAGLERFEAEVRTAKQAGAKVIRVVMIPGRRYERFDSVEEFRKLARRGLESLQLAEPVAARHQVRLAVENHKDQRIPERLEMLKRISSEYVGTCVDTGNSFALLEDPLEVVEAYAPWAFSVHLKDQAVREYDDGFLFADVPLGEGFLDLARMVRILRGARPEVRFSLELITRDPLEVPCLTEKYWATFADVPGRDLARTLRIVRQSACERLPHVNDRPLDEQVKLEEENVTKCLAYARDHLGL